MPIKKKLTITAQIKTETIQVSYAAISSLFVVDDHPEKVDQLAHAAGNHFDVQVTRDLKLITIRHYNDEVVKELCSDCEVVLKQQTPETVQVLLKEI